jgi:hypothetical protein
VRGGNRLRLYVDETREQYPDGPFTLHWLRYSAPQRYSYDDPICALRSAMSIEGDGDGSTEKITDRHGTVIYDLKGYPPKRMADGYPDVPEDL